MRRKCRISSAYKTLGSESVTYVSCRFVSRQGRGDEHDILTA
jgi:hypothetical protein